MLISTEEDLMALSTYAQEAKFVIMLPEEITEVHKTSVV